MTISILGSGAFGTALAVSLSRKGPVKLWTRSADQLRDMTENRVNSARLPGISLPEGVEVTGKIADTYDSSVLLLAVPVQHLRTLLAAHVVQRDGQHLVACCKGFELVSGQGPVSVIQNLTGASAPALLTGPSFADEIGKGLPTALALACSDVFIGEDLQARLSTDTLRLYRTTDTRGAELGGALKNVIAIACGAAIGAGLGNSARAALMTRGYAEMVRLASALGGHSDTLAGLSGFGDLALTCTSEQSRNFRLGLSLGRAEDFDPSVTTEGVATARAIASKSYEVGVDMPITRAVAALLDQKQSLEQVMSDLLNRTLKPE